MAAMSAKHHTMTLVAVGTSRHPVEQSVRTELILFCLWACTVMRYHSWYQDAKAAATEQNTGIIFTAPYTDASSGKLIMTAAAALYFDADKGMKLRNRR